ncbi:hypothetical protein [Roseinatronobacter bogoriensis]|uniref:Uncharacterized protein n=1 Tax=Roseinatronobacter bogoriensis subsp. barguzinensis TaxID=441209 RepID=A0A2K8KES9_9RHOB|nr:hypothetical protein [Rhodobaca]ATX67934.1 hypothetical protein BG454_14865 [Rhodobaca barguzinensis]MBB4206429.1 hypothetical protein [Rhodobaca bogoriensis DSM 18756]TDW41173.1 hypothetical protein LY39_00274 [Rhodobaca barguzinensis]TDY74649.1 hypothetical protein EV660_101690 [Rhodobaca bogoriensis DSM 18756]
MPKIDAIPDKFAAGYIDRLDGRTAIAQDMRARWAAMTDDLGGEGSLSYSQRSLIERALWLEHWLHVQERALADGDYQAFDAGKWTQACNSLQGILKTLGIERRAKDVTSLQDYIKGRAAS